MSQEENNFVYDWDSITIQLGKENEIHGSIRIMKQDMDNMKFLHGMERGEILEMLVEALETTEKPS
jgi:hypothetical protein